MAAVLLLVAAVSALAPAAPAPRTIASHCSPSGDVCYAVIDRSGAVHLEISTFAQYFRRYRLCVKPPTGAETCRSFPMRLQEEHSISRVVWYRNFPRRGPGVYRVTWKLGSNPLGPALRFRLPLRR
jgi:hypothetical protein